METVSVQYNVEVRFGVLVGDRQRKYVITSTLFDWFFMFIIGYWFNGSWSTI